MSAGRRVACAVSIDLGGLFLLARSVFVSTEVHFYSFLLFVSCIIIRSSYLFASDSFPLYSPCFYPCLWDLQRIICVRRFLIDMLVRYPQFDTYYLSDWPKPWRFWLKPRGRPRPLPCTSFAMYIISFYPPFDCLHHARTRHWSASRKLPAGKRCSGSLYEV